MRHLMQAILGVLAVTVLEMLLMVSGRKKLGVETSGVERSSCNARVWVLPKRQNKMEDFILDRQRDCLANVSHYPVAFIYCEQ